MTKQQKQTVALAGLVVLAALVWYLNSGRAIPGAADTHFMARTFQPLPVENPALHWDILHRTQKTEYKGGGRNPFSLQAEPAAVNPALVQADAKPLYHKVGPQREPPPVPPTWPGNVSFFGYGTVPNGTARRAFLTVDGEVQVVGEGDTLLGRYRILQVNNGNIEFQDISTGLRNTKSVDADKTAGPPAA
jgi:hypothetical protein